MAQTVTNLPAMEETWFQPLGQEYLLEKGWLPTLVFLPGESHGQRSLGGYGEQCHKESDRLKWLSTQHTHALSGCTLFFFFLFKLYLGKVNFKKKLF